ncbi:MAG: UDP-N-acetylmuramoyl-L-alanyl-D-glutamate--2,6-diaminopimelate ligase [Bradymonadaceae bacterium]
MKRLVDILSRVDAITLRSGVPAGVHVSNVTFDSRNVADGTLFVALRGARYDGHDYLEAAAEGGASAVLVERGSVVPELGIPVLEAANTRAALAPLATYFFDEPARAMRVVGITGTNGKTTTSYLLEEILKADGCVPGVIGTISYRWREEVIAAANTTPESLVLQELMARMRDDGVTDLIMEVSSHGLATHRLEGASFDVAIFTNLTQDHLDFHESMEAYRDAKRRLFLEYLPGSVRAGKEPVAVINIDDPEGVQLATLLEATPNVTSLTYGLESTDADFHCLRIQMSVDGAELEVRTPDGLIELHCPMLGRFNISNTLAAMAAAWHLGVNKDRLGTGLKTLVGVPGRLQRVSPGLKPAVFVDYAHTPDALERALETLRPHTSRRLIVAFGCGGERDRGKRSLMGAVAARLADDVVLTSDNPRGEEPGSIIDEILGGTGAGKSVVVQVNRRDAIAETIENAHEDDVILVAGKGHETYQEIAGKRHHFDDVEEAERALGARNQQRNRT